MVHNDSCGECWCFSEKDMYGGECRLDPPIPVLTSGTVTWRQPSVTHEGWCNNFKNAPGMFKGEIIDVKTGVEAEDKLAEMLGKKTPPKKKTVVKKKAVSK